MREARKERWRNTLSWFWAKLSSFVCAAAGAVMLYAISTGGISMGYLLCAPLMLVCGAFTFVIRGRIPVREVNCFLREDFPIPDVRRAAFFGDGCFVFWDAAGKVRLGYSSVSSAWEDEGRFYLFFQDRPPLVLPKRGFSGGTEEEFRDFLEREFGWPVERIK